MRSIKLDDPEYDLDTLSPEAKSQLHMLQVSEQELQRQQLQLAITQTTRNAYAQALKAALPTPLEYVMAQGETLKLS
jgi:hypothetical protein